MSKPANRFYLIAHQSSSFATFGELEACVLGADSTGSSPLNPDNYLVVEGLARPIATSLRLGDPVGTIAPTTDNRHDAVDNAALDRDVLAYLRTIKGEPAKVADIAKAVGADETTRISASLARINKVPGVVHTPKKGTWNAVMPVAGESQS